MSRIGKKPIIVPQEVKVNINGCNIKIQGSKGELSYKLSPNIDIQFNNNLIQLTTKNNSKKTQAIHGLARSILANMVTGVSEGFEKKLTIQGVGYRSQVDGKNLILNVGYSHPVVIKPPNGISIKVDNNTNISVMGFNKELVGQTAATIRSIRPPEPYKGKGIKYIDEIIRRKVGKAGK